MLPGSDLTTAIHQAMEYCPFLLGAAVSLRLARFPDVGLEGSFALGGCVVVLALPHTHHLALLILLAGLAGLLGGLFTSLQYYVLKIPSLVCGIVTALVAFSSCFLLLGNRSEAKTFVALAPDARLNTGPLVFTVVTVGVLALLLILLSTRHGLLLRFSGASPLLIRSLGGNAPFRGAILIAIGNAIVGASGALVSVTDGTASLNFGTGKLFLAITALILGEAVATGIADLFYVALRRQERRQRLQIQLDRYASASSSLPYLSAAILGSFAYWGLWTASTVILGADVYSKLIIGLLTMSTLALLQLRRGMTPWFPSWGFN